MLAFGVGDGFAERLGEGGFAGAGVVFEQDVAVGEEGGDDEIDDLVAAFHGGAEAAAEDLRRFIRRGQGMDGLGGFRRLRVAFHGIPFDFALADLPPGEGMERTSGAAPPGDTGGGFTGDGASEFEPGGAGAGGGPGTERVLQVQLGELLKFRSAPGHQFGEVFAGGAVFALQADVGEGVDAPPL